jgi:hypothetical protein
MLRHAHPTLICRVCACVGAHGTTDECLDALRREIARTRRERPDLNAVVTESEASWRWVTAYKAERYVAVSDKTIRDAAKKGDLRWRRNAKHQLEVPLEMVLQRWPPHPIEKVA